MWYWVLVFLQIVFGLMALVIAAEYRRRGSPALLLGVGGYGLSAFLSFVGESGWPLLIGFILMIGLKRLGYDLG